MRTLLISGDSPALLRREALATARRLLCPEHRDGNLCSVCRRIRDDSHPDFLRVRPDGPQIKVEDVRDAVRFASGRPYEGPARMIWIDGADALREAGANALLKSLEEPGDSVQWLLTTTSPESILATIRSRCVHRRLSPRRPSELAAGFEADGLAPADARDAVAFGFDPGEAVDLDSARESRRRLLGALADGSVIGPARARRRGRGRRFGSPPRCFGSPGRRRPRVGGAFRSAPPRRRGFARLRGSRRSTGAMRFGTPRAKRTASRGVRTQPPEAASVRTVVSQAGRGEVREIIGGRRRTRG